MNTTFESDVRKQAPLFPTAMKYGVIAGLGGIIMSVIFYFWDMSTSQIPGYLSWVILLIAVILGMREYRDDLSNGRMTFGQGVSLGLLISLVSGIISVIWFMIFINTLEPDFMEQMLLRTEQQLIEQGQSDEIVEQTIEVTKQFMTPIIMSTVSLFSYIIFGLIISLIVAAFTKREV